MRLLMKTIAAEAWAQYIAEPYVQYEKRRYYLPNWHRSITKEQHLATTRAYVATILFG